MLRYSSGLTVTATTPRRPGGDSGRARRKVRGAARGDGGGSRGARRRARPPGSVPFGAGGGALRWLFSSSLAGFSRGARGNVFLRGFARCREGQSLWGDRLGFC